MNCWLNCETTAVTQTVSLCGWGCNLVSQPLLVDICMGSHCWGRLPFEIKQWRCADKPFLSLWCRAAWPQPQAACFTLWLTIIPALPFTQGPPSPCQLRGLRALFWVGAPNWSAGRDTSTAASVLSRLPRHAAMFPVCNVVCSILFFFPFKNSAKAG